LDVLDVRLRNSLHLALGVPVSGVTSKERQGLPVRTGDQITAASVTESPVIIIVVIVVIQLLMCL
jgi:hypothetical protein